MNDLSRIRLKALRKEKLKTQEDMSKVLGVTRSTYTNYENGYINPPSATIEALAKYFNVSIDYLLGKTNFTTHEEQKEAPNDILDISKQLNMMLDYLNDNSAALTLDGEPLDQDSRELLISSLENSLKVAKKLNGKGWYSLEAKDIIEKYNSRNPYEIARKENIIVVFEPLGNIYGYYNNVLGIRFIHINENVQEHLQRDIVECLLYPALNNKEKIQFITRKDIEQHEWQICNVP